MHLHVSFIPHRHRAGDDAKRFPTRLVGLLLFNGIGAVFGGLGLLTDSIAVPGYLLDGTPFTDYTIPGWILLLAVGGTSLGAALAMWRSMRHAEIAALLAGAVLLGWIVTEFVLIPEGWAPQLLYVLIALAILRYGWAAFQQRRTQAMAP